MMGKYEDFAGDLVVIGSDEVFSLEIGVNPFLYGNGLNAKHIISYAGCFGPTTYEDVVKQGQQKMISDGLHHMDAVSVRDQNSLETVKKTADIDATLVCDPVILYGYEKDMQSFRPPIKDYILIYSYDKNLNDTAEYNYIKAYADKHSLKIVSVGYYHRWCKCIDASPFELLGWIKNATLVVTDTFHGSVVSIICNTTMVVKLRGNLPDGKIQTVNSMKFHTREVKAKCGIMFKYHYLRHTYGTMMAELNTPQHLLCSQMGHGNIQVTQRYYIALSKAGIDILRENLNRL